MFERESNLNLSQNGYFNYSDGPDEYLIMDKEHVQVFINAIKRAKPHLPLLGKSATRTIIKIGSIELYIGAFSFAFVDDLSRGFKFTPEDKKLIDAILEEIYTNSTIFYQLQKD